MGMGFGGSELEMLQYLADPTTSSKEITLLAKNVERLITNQERMLNIIYVLIDFYEKYEGTERDE